MLIDKSKLLDFITRGLNEDIGEGDHTSLACIPAEEVSKARLLVKNDGIIAGVNLAEMIFHHLDPDMKFTVFKNDGDDVQYGEIAYEIEGKTRAILAGERFALNNMQHMSGIATLARRFQDEVSGLQVKILDTRKTTPLNRLIEKWAVNIGGCENYRFGLYDWIMLKDNHVDAAGGIEMAIKRVHDYLHKNKLKLRITLEVRNLIEVDEALRIGGIHRIMLDNFEIPILAEAVRVIDGKFETEASGGITLNNVRMYAQTGVDYISIGALTHSAEQLDLSLKISK